MGSSKQGGQRGNTGSASGRKARSTTSTPHSGSRVEPSHVTEHVREVREKKTASQAKRRAGKNKG